MIRCLKRKKPIYHLELIYAILSVRMSLGRSLLRHIMIHWYYIKLSQRSWREYLPTDAQLITEEIILIVQFIVHCPNFTFRHISTKTILNLNYFSILKDKRTDITMQIAEKAKATSLVIVFLLHLCQKVAEDKRTRSSIQSISVWQCQKVLKYIYFTLKQNYKFFSFQSIYL